LQLIVTLSTDHDCREKRGDEPMLVKTTQFPDIAKVSIFRPIFFRFTLKATKLFLACLAFYCSPFFPRSDGIFRSILLTRRVEAGLRASAILH
jgi:hypothetical protein